jgi:serine/threonine-protein kinase
VTCLDEETLLDLVRGRLEGEGLAAAEAHVAACDACAALVAHAAPMVERVNAASTLASRMAAAPVPVMAAAAPAPANLPLEAGAVVKGTYRVLRCIGKGGMGIVYEVSHARLRGRYALKLMSPQFAADQAALSRFRREAQVTSSLRHPNIVQVIDFDESEDGRAFLAMEYLSGPTLAGYLADTGALPLELALPIVEQIVGALAAAHAAGVVHRDLKPENVILVPREGGGHLVKLLDFGLSKMRAVSLRITHSEMLLGTPGYMTPEQALGQIDSVDARTDQYALATLVWEMLAGRPLFRGDSVNAVLYQVVNVEPPPLEGVVPAAVEGVLRTALAKRQEDRFPSVSAFAEALARAAAEKPVRDPPPTVRSLPAATPPRRPALVVGGVAIATAALGLWAVAHFGSRPEGDAGGARPGPAPALPSPPPPGTAPTAAPAAPAAPTTGVAAPAPAAPAPAASAPSPPTPSPAAAAPPPAHEPGAPGAPTEPGPSARATPAPGGAPTPKASRPGRPARPGRATPAPLPVVTAPAAAPAPREPAGAQVPSPAAASPDARAPEPKPEYPPPLQTL